MCAHTHTHTLCQSICVRVSLYAKVTLTVLGLFRDYQPPQIRQVNECNWLVSVCSASSQRLARICPSQTWSGLALFMP